ncbi:hypothetical protein GCM10028791_33730 [Echinicola sediminis]
MDSKDRKAHLLIFIVLSGTFINEILCYIMAKKVGNNSILYNVVGIYLMTFLYLIYFRMVFRSHKMKTWSKAAIGILLGVGIINSLFIQPIATIFQNYSLICGSFLIIILSIFFYYNVFKHPAYEEVILLSSPHFWIITMLFFYYASTLLIFASWALILPISLEFTKPLHSINRLLASIAYMVMGLAFYAPKVFTGKYFTT